MKWFALSGNDTAMACPLVDIANHGSKLNGDAMVWSGMGLVKQFAFNEKKCHEPKSGMDYGKNAMYLKTENAITKGR